MILQITVQKYIPTNAYFYVDDNSRHGFLIDPGAEADKLLRKDLPLRLEFLLPDRSAEAFL